MRAALLIVAACGGTAPPPAVPPAPPRAIAKTSCADAGVILRGVIEAQAPDAGRDREAAIARACTADHWPAAALDCIGSSRSPEACLDQHLSPQVIASYQIALAEWAATYEASSDLDTDVPVLACNDVIRAVDRASGDVTIERDWVLAARKRVLAMRCAIGWSQDTLHCLATTDSLPPCVDRETNKDELAADLAAIDARATAIAAAKRTPATIACSKVVAAHYADAKWPPNVPQADRKKSRAAMLRACTSDAWNDTLRACLATGGDATCFSDLGVTSRWGYPAFEVATSQLPRECDDLRITAGNLEHCAALPAQTRSAISESLARMEQHAHDDDVAKQCAAIAQKLRALPGC